MEKTNGSTKNITFAFAIKIVMLLAGLVSVIVATSYDSYILAFVGITLAFWAALLFYININTLPIELFNAVAVSALQNNERMLSRIDPSAKGIYLPPKYLVDYKSDLVYVPSKVDSQLPMPEEIRETALLFETSSGLLFVPPGLALASLYEQKLTKSFLQIDLDTLLTILPDILVEKVEIAQAIEITKEGTEITVRATKPSLKGLCSEMKELPRTHRILGCPFSSSIACALAKSTGKLVTIEEEQEERATITKIRYSLRDS